MSLVAYVSRVPDYIPFVSIAKGFYYITKANQKEKAINDIVQEILNDEKLGKISSEEASVSMQYININKTKVEAIHFRGELACIPVIGNLIIAIHDIRGLFIKDGYHDSLEALSEWNI